MDSTKKESNTQSVLRRYARVMAFAVLGVATVHAFVYFSPLKHIVYAPKELTEDVEATTNVSLYARSAPVRLMIPKIQLDTTFVAPLGLNDDKTVSVPDSYDKVGWYKNGVTPGEIGSSVILGHVDSYQGAAVFYRLGQLETGDEVEVVRADGTIAIFVVTSKERVSQEAFPTEKVYGKINHAGLRLVTCTGIYNHGKLKYSHNLIVYTELKK